MSPINRATLEKDSDKMTKKVIAVIMFSIVMLVAMVHMIQGQEAYHIDYFTVQNFEYDHRPERALLFDFYYTSTMTADNHLSQAIIGYDALNDLYYVDEITIEFAGEFCGVDGRCLSEEEVYNAVLEIVEHNLVFVYNVSVETGKFEHVLMFPEHRPESLYDGSETAEQNYRLAVDYWRYTQLHRNDSLTIVYLPVISR